jgi:DNA-binding response OmpR family regulator
MKPATGQQTVLVADDDPTIHVLFRKILHSTGGIRLLTCLDGKEAQRLALEHQPDIIFLDVLMPEIDGLDVCRHLRSQPSTALTPILFLSGRASDRLRGLELGANDYLLKPVDIAELKAKCRTYLRLSALQKKFVEMERRRTVTGLLRGLAHQFNNILCGLSGAAQVLDLRMPPESSLRDNCRTIVQYSQRAATLSQQLLVLAGARREVGECRTQEMLESAHTAWEAAQSGTPRIHELQTTCHIPSDVRIAMGAADFQACLFHLMQNSIRSMEAPGTILLHLDRDGTQLVATLTDQGRGMTPQELHQALDPFVQNRDRPSDAGLGLPFVRALVEESGGTLELESSPLQGTRAVIHLPMR